MLFFQVGTLISMFKGPNHGRISVSIGMENVDCFSCLVRFFLLRPQYLAVCCSPTFYNCCENLSPLKETKEVLEKTLIL